MTTRYRALEVVSTVYKIIAVLTFFITVLATIATLISSFQVINLYGPRTGFALAPALLSGITFLIGMLLTVGIYAVGEFISLLIEVALNTRQASESAHIASEQMQYHLKLMQQQLQLQQRTATEKRTELA